MKRFVYTAWFITFALAAIVGALQLAGFAINTSPSMPRGLWRVHRAAPSRDSIVLVCPPDTADFRQARASGVVPPGRCPGHYEPLLKSLVAIAGDEIGFDTTGLTVNGAHIAGPPFVSSLSRLIPYGRYHVEEDDLWVISRHPRSWDSRHFGPLSKHGFLGVAEPVFTESTP